jgi:hypothetical protein
MLLTERPAWKALEAHHKDIRRIHLRTLFADDPDRGEALTAEAAGLYLDYSKNRITRETIGLLVNLAEECGLRERAAAMFRGDQINVTEKRAVLHTALRAPRDAAIMVDGHNVVPDVYQVLDRMDDFARRVRDGRWLGFTGKRVRNVVNIGIGGSELGPVMAYEALRHYSQRDLTFRFVSNVDGTDFCEATRDLDPAETLFIVASKTFTTQETMANAHAAKDWFDANGGTAMLPLASALPGFRRRLLRHLFPIVSIARLAVLGGRRCSLGLTSLKCAWPEKEFCHRRSFRIRTDFRANPSDAWKAFDPGQRSFCPADQKPY